jgi:integrase
LLYATSGLRRNEALFLNKEDVDLEQRIILPTNAHITTRTKKSWYSFFNEEAVQALREYLLTRNDDNPRLFPFTEYLARDAFKRAYEKTGIKITPQLLREWFCSEMGRLNVPDRYVDAFCGRVPRSILARHYTDFSPERLKEIYDKANLTVLT